MAIYPAAVKKLIAPDARDPLIDPDLTVLHVDAGNASSLYEWWVKNGVNECHFFVKKSGVVEQYVDTKWQADAQVGGGSKGISIETQGFGDGEWTPEQLAAIKALLRWIHAAHPKVPMRPPANPYDAGIGYHSMWPSSRAGTWARDGRTCPGPDRIKQYRTVLVPWMSNPTTTTPAPAAQEDTMTPEQEKKLDYVSAQVKAVAQLVIDMNAREVARDAAYQSALTEAVAHGAVDPAVVTKAVTDALSGLSANLTIAPKEPQA